MSWLVYILKVNAALMVCWALYRTGFKQLTFFHWNRAFLQGSVVLSFVLPWASLHLDRQIFTSVEFSGRGWVYADHLVSSSDTASALSVGSNQISILLVLYSVITLIFLAISTLRLISRVRNLRHARKIRDGKVKVYVLDNCSGSFTLFRRIYLDRHNFDNQLEPVYRHEMIHAVQLHSIDLLVMELVVHLFWFNPMVFLLKRYVRENHEYLADDPARSSRESLLEFLACLREESIRHHAPAIASNFKSSTIKKRIVMLTNQPTRNHRKWRYLAILPILAAVTLAFQLADPVASRDPDEGGAKVYFSDGIPSVFPLPEKYAGKVTWKFNEKAIHPITGKERVHNGIDIAAPLGTPVAASAEGVVRKAENLEGWGNLVLLEHADGFETIYAHLDAFRVRSGETVKKGQLIGSVGNTGQSTGPHLHYEVRRGGEHVDPADYY